jgi:hypothetical protein
MFAQQESQRRESEGERERERERGKEKGRRRVSPSHPLRSSNVSCSAHDWLSSIRVGVAEGHDLLTICFFLTPETIADAESSVLIVARSHFWCEFFLIPFVA